MTILRQALCATAFLGTAAFAAPQIADAPDQETRVDVELMLAVDVSYSISVDELEIQRRGYASALRDPQVWAAIDRGYYQQIALTYVEWSGVGQHRVVAPWTLISSPADLDAFASQLTTRPARALRRTSISSVLDHAPDSFESNGFDGRRRVIDVSGDGPNNMGRPVADARDELVAAGYVINGLPLTTHDGSGALPELGDLDAYYEHCVIGGPMSFVVPVRSWEEFVPAVRKKLILELAGERPLPVARAAWTGRRSDGSYDCLIGEKIWQLYVE